MCMKGINKFMNFGINLKKIRLDNNLTQEELAKKINTSRSNIANYENNKNMPSIDVLEKLSVTLNCSTDYLMGLTLHQNPKEELEKELYNFDLTEEEYYDAINCFMYDDTRAISLLLSLSNEKMAKTKEYNVLLTIFSYVSDYVSNVHLPNDKTAIDPLVRQKFEEELEKTYRPAKKLLLSLDKSKIIHNYNENFSQKIKEQYGETSINLLENYSKLNGLGKQKVEETAEECTAFSKYTEKKETPQEANG